MIDAENQPAEEFVGAKKKQKMHTKENLKESVVQVSSSSSEGSATVTPPTSPRPAERTQPFLQPRIILKPAILANERDSSDHLSYIRRFQSVSKAPPKKTTMEDFVAKKQPRRKKALEVFCGCGALSGAMAESGFEVKGVDFDGNKDKPQVHVSCST